MSTTKALLSRIMETAARKLGCDKGTLYLHDEKTNQLWTAVLQNDLISEIRVEPPQGLAGYSFWHNQVMNVDDAYTNPYFSQRTDELTGYRTRNVLCMPVPDKSGKAIGVAQMINKSDGTVFDAEDIEKMRAMVKEITDLLDKSDTWPALIPGLALAGVVALLGWSAHYLVPAALKDAISPVLFIVLLGVAVSNLLILPLRYLPGIRFTMRQLLRFGIVLMGARLALNEVAHVGVQSLLLIVALILIAVAVAMAIGRMLKIPQKLAVMIAVGTAVCGGSAIAAIAPVIKARDEEFSFAVSVNTLMGMLAVLSFPLIGHLFGWNDQFFGMWAGTAVNDTAQVLATAYAYSPAAGDTATIIKLVRNSLMVFVVVAAGLFYIHLDKEGKATAKDIPFKKRLKESVPGFVFGFLLLALLNSAGLFTGLSTLTGFDVPALLAHLTNDVVFVSLAGVGLGTSIANFRRVGMRPVVVALMTFVITAIASALLIRVII